MERLGKVDAEKVPGLKLEDWMHAYAALMAKARAAGLAIAAADGYIAAIAATNGFAVATRATSPFEAAGAAVINPWEV